MANRLVPEKSPYLLQHAHNPVDWYPWGREAFDAAAARDVPIFLSIGYSTCHWCHVMERESFEDGNVAKFLNENFVPIKVDREERPDVDEVYMAAVQAMSGGGGWPMSVFLTPALKPFYAGTYFPPKPAYGRPSFLQLLERITELWQTDRNPLVESSEALADAIKEDTDAGERTIGMESADHCYAYFRQSFDRTEGGFGGAPKFPRSVQFDFLLNYWYQTGDDHARDMSLLTLRKMAMGGLYDHIGGGFHRYSVDRFWRVSHFEKMLYDQALLTNSYLDAWQITKDPFYSTVAKGICDYVLRDLTSPEGGFYCAEDADSEGEEGKFYAWTKQEIEDLLGERAAVVIRHFGILEGGNFEHGKNVLHTTVPLEDIARERSMTLAEVQDELQSALNTLYSYREGRVRPHLDDKVLTSWNGLMIGAMAATGSALGEERYLSAARNSAEFVWTQLHGADGLLHRWRDGEAKIAAMLDDHAFLVRGFLQLYRATFDGQWLERAIALQTEQDARLWDAEGGGYFTSQASPEIIVRRKNGYDGAEPSGNSVSALNLIELAALTEDDEYLKKAQKIVKYFGSTLAEHPYAMPELVVAAMRLSVPNGQVVFTGPKGGTLKMMRALVNSWVPDVVMIHRESAIGAFAKSLPETQDATAYYCRDFVCELPVTDSEALMKLVRSGARSTLNA